MVDTFLSGQPHTANTPDVNTEVKRMLQENMGVGVPVDEVTEELKISQGLAHYIHDVLQYLIVSAKQITKYLTPDLKKKCHDNAKFIYDEAGALLQGTLTGDKCKVHYFQKRQNETGMFFVESNDVSYNLVGRKITVPIPL